MESPPGSESATQPSSRQRPQRLHREASTTYGALTRTRRAHSASATSATGPRASASETIPSAPSALASAGTRTTRAPAAASAPSTAPDSMRAAIRDGEQRDGSPLGDERTGVDERLDRAREPGDAAGRRVWLGGDLGRAPEAALHGEPRPTQRPQESQLPAPGAPGVLEGPARRRDARARCDRIHGHRRQLTRGSEGVRAPHRGGDTTHTQGETRAPARGPSETSCEHARARETARDDRGRPRKPKGPKPVRFRALPREAPGGFEPPNTGFADPCLTTWRRCRTEAPL